MSNAIPKMKQKPSLAQKYLDHLEHGPGTKDSLSNTRNLFDDLDVTDAILLSATMAFIARKVALAR